MQASQQGGGCKAQKDTLDWLGRRWWQHVTIGHVATCDHISALLQPSPSLRDTGNNVIRLLSNGVISTYAGNGTSGCSNGAASSAMFNSPAGVATDASGQVYVADTVGAPARSSAMAVLSLF